MAQVGLAKIKVTEMGPAQVWLSIGMLLPPLLPRFYTLLEDIKVLLISHSAAPLLHFCLEVAQQPLECLLIRLRVCPTCKIPNMARVANKSRPASPNLHHSIIQTDWKKYDTFLFTLSL